MKNLVLCSLVVINACLASGCASSTSADEKPAQSEAALGGGSHSSYVTCESDGGYRTCFVPTFGRITSVRVVREHSFGRCNENFSYGSRFDYVWVDLGCAADFEVRSEIGGGCGTLREGESIRRGERLESCDKQTAFVHQSDGNLALVHDGHTLWNSNALDARTDRVEMRIDGNLVQTNRSGRTVWSANTHGNPGAYLDVQDNCNAVVYDRFGIPLWASNTECR